MGDSYTCQVCGVSVAMAFAGTMTISCWRSDCPDRPKKPDLKLVPPPKAA